MTAMKATKKPYKDKFTMNFNSELPKEGSK